MNIDVTTDICVFTDPDYHYRISVGEQIELRYVENGDPSRTASVHFASLEEMTAIAKHMLKAAEFAKTVSQI